MYDRFLLFGLHSPRHQYSVLQHTDHHRFTFEVDYLSVMEDFNWWNVSNTKDMIIQLQEVASTSVFIHGRAC